VGNQNEGKDKQENPTEAFDLVFVAGSREKEGLRKMKEM
jgi:hypothetical protein